MNNVRNSKEQHNSFKVLLFMVAGTWLFFVSVHGIKAQNFSPYFTLEQHQQYIDYLITSGNLKISHPLSQPYHVNELLDSLEKLDSQNNHWMKLLKKDLLKYNSNYESSGTSGKITLLADANYTFQRIEDVTDGYFGLNTSITYNWRNLGMHYRYTLDEHYKNDSLYFGTTGKLGFKTFGRASEAYLEWQGRNASLFVGRINRNFGL
ncbi:MAG: hypothetical protein IQL11_14520, partial [Bacteroidales bacterium]|nr:hypothetical protein [Bacteroidales bacterium]